ITDDIAGIGIRNANLQVADWLEQYRGCIRHTVLVSDGSSHLEGHFGGVYRMVGTVNQCSLQTNNRITCQNTVSYAVLQAFFNGWEEGLRNSTAEYLFFKYQ